MAAEGHAAMARPGTRWWRRFWPARAAPTPDAPGAARLALEVEECDGNPIAVTASILMPSPRRTEPPPPAAQREAGDDDISAGSRYAMPLVVAERILDKLIAADPPPTPRDVASFILSSSAVYRVVQDLGPDEVWLRVAQRHVQAHNDMVSGIEYAGGLYGHDAHEEYPNVDPQLIANAHERFQNVRRIARHAFTGDTTPCVWISAAGRYAKKWFLELHVTRRGQQPTSAK